MQLARDIHIAVFVYIFQGEKAAIGFPEREHGGAQRGAQIGFGLSCRGGFDKQVILQGKQRMPRQLAPAIERAAARHHGDIGGYPRPAFIVLFGVGHHLEQGVIGALFHVLVAADAEQDPPRRGACQGKIAGIKSLLSQLTSDVRFCHVSASIPSRLGPSPIIQQDGIKPYRQIAEKFFKKACQAL